MQNSKIQRDPPEELTWIEQTRENPNAFQPIFDKYHDVIFNYVLRRTGNPNLAQDITANTFLKAINHLKDFTWQGVSLSSWLYRIATNEINEHHRKFKRMVPLTAELTDTLRSERNTDTALLEIEESIARNEKFKAISSALSKLKLKYQTVLTLRYFEDKSMKEIAEILDLPENTVKTRIRRGLIQIRKRL
ncbi:RNA polymerase sigma factor [candidate division KSB1 bacterium]|nr:RNA polymerase sigma factor [candidate division KSB1 bacterium]NIR72065.1 RNA polymerase sigma factor [candidate division KSB1 bacterium]NIS26576.1 RNA polymerase sigma factor [candidate division KSB1 bacterium]NIT73338.1 RNA polymerase sigma factor [candidate division KSB1 bacterium]NIU27186.1 RNA polymerase sigma factor [candidate division KSB1 bacterium]